AISLNFLTHHFLPDVRYLLAAAVLLVFRRTWVAFTPLDKQRGIPLVLAFLLVGMFVWFAEDIATFLGAWQYPHQADGWRLVDPRKLTSWALLVIVSMMAVVQLKHVKGARAPARARTSWSTEADRRGCGQSRSSVRASPSLSAPCQRARHSSRGRTSARRTAHSSVIHTGV